MKNTTSNFSLLQLAYEDILQQEQSARKIRDLVEFLSTLVQRNRLSHAVKLAEMARVPLERFQAYSIVVSSVYRSKRFQDFYKETEKSPLIKEWAESIVYFAKQQPFQPGMLELARCLIDSTDDALATVTLYARMLSVSETQQQDLDCALNAASQVADREERFKAYRLIHRSMKVLPPPIKRYGLDFIRRDLLVQEVCE